MNKPLGPYTPVVRAGDWVIVSGQLGLADGKMVEGGVLAETAQAMKNLKERLAEEGCDISDVQKTTLFILDMGQFGAINEVYVEALGDHRPARSCIAVSALPSGGQFEVEAWAYKPQS